jgi:hypothetical protein
MAQHLIRVSCGPTESGWRCEVVVGDDANATTHVVAVDTAELERLAGHDPEPRRLVRDSFEFLLAREPRESILRSFNLSRIGHYFPEWEAEIRQRS